MIWGGTPRTGREKGSRAQATGSHVVWGGTPRIGWGKGARAQSPKSKSSTGGGPYWKGIRQRRRHVGKNKNDLIVFLGCYKREGGPVPRDRVQSPNRAPRGEVLT